MRKSRFLFLFLFVGLLVLLGAAPAFAQTEGPLPLPRDCGGVNPPEYLPPTCCAYGYVYDADGTVLDGLTVAVQGPSGTLSALTKPGEFSDAPYFTISLSEAPLSVGVGDTITFTVNYNGRSRILPYQVSAGGQQVDLVVPTDLSDTPIYYVSGSESARQIWRMNGDGTGQTYVRSGEDPDICPLNGRVLYVAGNDIHVMDINGNYIRNLTSESTPPGSYGAFNPDWSPDCSQIVYTAIYPNWRYTLVRMNADGSSKVVLPSPAGSEDDWYPDWSPDGQWIAFTSDDGDNIDTNIYKMHPDGSNITLLAHNAGWYPVWSPDNTRIAFVGQDGPAQHTAIMNVDGSDLHFVDHEPAAWWPYWISNNRLMYVGDGDVADGLDLNILTINADGTDKYRLTADAYYRSPTVRPTSPPIATIHRLTPDHVLRNRDVVTFSGLGQDADELGAQIVSYTWESSKDGILSTQPVFTLTASALSSGTHIITLTVMDDERDVATAKQALVVTETVFNADVLILTNRARLAELHSPVEADSVLQKLDELAQATNGLILTVEDDPVTATAYADWMAHPTSFVHANRVADAIHTQIMAQLNHSPDIAHIVIAGDDRVIPFRRILDRTNHPEHLYQELVPESITGAALAADRYLTDDFYGNYAPLRRDGVLVYLPDMAVGRLVETPEQIVGQIEKFLSGEGIVVEDTIVTGYDFMVDSALEMCSALRRDGLVPDCTLINNVWTSSQFVNRVLNTMRQLISYNGHANHYQIETPNGTVSSLQVLNRTIVGNALVWTPGCHGALNVPPETAEALDTVEAWVNHGASVIGNTGYGWGYNGSIGLSELLMLDLTMQVLDSDATTSGQALMAAKQQYYTEDVQLDKYDEKILMEATLYGIPMIRVTTPDVQHARTVSAPPYIPILPSAVYLTGSGYLTVTSVHYDFPQLTDIISETVLGTDYIGQAERNAGAPAQPRYIVPITPIAKTYLVPHGVVLRGAAGHDEPDIDPVVMRPVLTGDMVADEPIFNANVWFPADLVRLNRANEQNALAFSVGQFHGVSQTQRFYDAMDIDVYYNYTDDWEPPTLLNIESSLDHTSSVVTVTVVASDTNGIHSVVVAYTNGDGHWASIDLSLAEDVWHGNFLGHAISQFIPQVVDNAGNVTTFSRMGRYMQPGDIYNPMTVFLPLVLRGFGQ